MLPDKAEAVLERGEYICQALDFTPQSLIDSVYNTFYDYGVEGMESLKNILKQEFGEFISESELNEGSNKVLEHFLLLSETKFAKLDGYLFRNIFQVPDDFVFPEDEIQLKLKASEEADQKLDDEHKKLMQQIKEQKFKNACLRQQTLELNKTIAEYSKMVDFFENLIDTAKRNQITTMDDIRTVTTELNETKK